MSLDTERPTADGRRMIDSPTPRTDIALTDEQIDTVARLLGLGRYHRAAARRRGEAVHDVEST